MRIARLLAATTAAMVLAVLTGGPAWAHNSLVDASPAKNATLAEAPEQVRLTFLQRVDPAALSIEVTDAQRRKIPADEPAAKGKVGTLTFREPPANGTYTVTYRVVSLDGHPVQGSYKFTVDDPAATPEPSSSAPAAPPSTAPPSAAAAPKTVPASTESAGAGWWPLAAGIAVVVLLAAGALFAMRRRRTI
jgi:methionine-rich copper-binding protein CopC